MLIVVKVNNKIARTMSCCIIFNFEHIKQINLTLLLLTFSMYFSVGHQIKSTKQYKCKLNNKGSFFKTISCM